MKKAPGAGGRGTLLMVLAANAPDADVVCTLGGATSYIHWHRNITHALIAMPVMALATVAVVRLIARTPVKWLPAFFAALIGVVSHLLLDLTNNYGVRLLLPFSGRWFSLDTTPVVDFTIWAILLLGVAAPWFGRLVGSEIGEKKRTPGPGWAIASLLLLATYDYTRLVMHARAVAMVASRQYTGGAALRAAAFPTGDPLVWHGVAELAGSWVTAPVNIRSEYDPAEAVYFVKPPVVPAMSEASRTDAFQRFYEFVQYPVWKTTPGQLALIDLRFGTPADPGFEAIATVDAAGHVVDSEFTFGSPRPR